MSKTSILQRPIHGIVVSNADLIARSVGGAFDSYSVANSDGRKISKEDRRRTQIVVIVRKATTDALLHLWLDWANENDIPVVYAERKAAVLQHLQDNFDVLDAPKPEAPAAKEVAKEAKPSEVIHVDAPDDDPMSAAIRAITATYESKLSKARADKDEAETMALELSEQVSTLTQRLEDLTTEDRALKAENSTIDERVKGRVEIVLNERLEALTRDLRDKIRKQNKTLSEKENDVKKLRVEVKDLRSDLKDRAKIISDLEEKLKSAVFTSADLHRILGAAMVAHALSFSDDEDLVQAFDTAVEVARQDPNFSKALSASIKTNSMVKSAVPVKRATIKRAAAEPDTEDTILFSPRNNPDFRRVIS